MKVLATGMFSFPRTGAGASAARARITPLPAMINGYLASRMISAARSMVAGGGDRLRRIEHRQGSLALHVHLGDVLGQIDETHPRLLALRLLEGLAHDFGNGLRLDHLHGVLGDRPEQVDQVQMLVRFLVDPRRRRLARNGHQRGMIQVGVRHAGHQVGRARPERRQAYAGPSGQSPVNVGDEGGRLLVTRGDETNLAVRQDIQDVDVFFAGDAENGLHALVFQTADE